MSIHAVTRASGHLDHRARIELLKRLFRMPAPQLPPDVAAAVNELLSQVSAIARSIDSGHG